MRSTKAVEMRTARFLGHLKQPRLSGVVDDIRYDEILVKERSIRKNTALLMRRHPQVRTVGQDLAVGELLAENILVLIGKKLDFAAGPLSKSRNDL